jgi:hypothetical protein
MPRDLVLVNEVASMSCTAYDSVYASIVRLVGPDPKEDLLC